jgi:hypothetical protein
VQTLRCAGSQPDAPNGCTVCRQHYSCAAIWAISLQCGWRQQRLVLLHDQHCEQCRLLDGLTAPCAPWKCAKRFGWRGILTTENTHKMKHKQNKTARRSTRISTTGFCISEMVTKMPRYAGKCNIIYAQKKTTILVPARIFLWRPSTLTFRENTINGLVAGTRSRTDGRGLPKVLFNSYRKSIKTNTNILALHSHVRTLHVASQCVPNRCFCSCSTASHLRCSLLLFGLINQLRNS